MQMQLKHKWKAGIMASFRATMSLKTQKKSEKKKAETAGNLIEKSRLVAEVEKMKGM